MATAPTTRPPCPSSGRASRRSSCRRCTSRWPRATCSAWLSYSSGSGAQRARCRLPQCPNAPMPQCPMPHANAHAQCSRPNADQWSMPNMPGGARIARRRDARAGPRLQQALRGLAKRPTGDPYTYQCPDAPMPELSQSAKAPTPKATNAPMPQCPNAMQHRCSRAFARRRACSGSSCSPASTSSSR